MEMGRVAFWGDRQVRAGVKELEGVEIELRLETYA